MGIEQDRQAIRTLKALSDGDVVAYTHPEDVDEITDEDRRLLEVEGVELIVSEHVEPGGLTFMRKG